MVVVGIGCKTSIVSVLSTVGLKGKVVTAVVLAVTVLVVTTIISPLESASEFLYPVHVKVNGSTTVLPFLQVYSFAYVKVYCSTFSEEIYASTKGRYPAGTFSYSTIIPLDEQVFV